MTRRRYAFKLTNLIGGDAIRRETSATGLTYYEAACKVVERFPPSEGWYITGSASNAGLCDDE